MRIYQIYYNESQIDQLQPGYIPYFNERCTVFFEHSVMRSLIEEKKHDKADYFGVVSYKIFEKLAHPNIEPVEEKEFSTNQFLYLLYKNKPEVMGFQRYHSADPVEWAEKYHPNFKKYWIEITNKIGYRWVPEIFMNNIYCNFFVAKSEIYERFVKEMLAPAMDVMSGMVELYEDSKYVHKLPLHLQKDWGIKHYPYHAFLCERLISYYIHIHNLRTSFY